MTLKDLLIKINDFSSSQKLVKTAMSGTSLYAINGRRGNSYPLLFSSPTGDHRIEGTTTTYEITLYYFDRLLEDDSNDIDIFSSSIEELRNIVNAIGEFKGVLKVIDGWDATNFSDGESFNDRIAGAYATIQVVCDNSYNCVID